MAGRGWRGSNSESPSRDVALGVDASGGSTVQGTYTRKFSQVREEFERNFAERGEVGASVCVKVRGETVVDLWGGVARRATDSAPAVAWKQDTIGHVWSATKGATALCAHMLVSRGQLNLNAPVSAYWPEFGESWGKDKILVRQLLSHQAGLAAVRTPLPAGAFYDWELMTRTLAAEEPFWEPGTRNGYHAFTFGFLVGELVRRVSGRSLGTFFRAEVATPLGLDFWIGLPVEHEVRVAPTIPADPPQPGDPLPTFYLRAFSDPASLQALVLGNLGGYLDPGESDSRAAHAAEIGAVGGITNARALARMYELLANGGAVDGIGLVNRDQLLMMAAVSSATSSDCTLLVPTRFAPGFVKSMDNTYLPPGDSSAVLMSETAFGHNGLGGSMGFADPDACLSFGYTMNKQGTGLGLNERGESLVNAVYRALGYRQVPGGFAR
jgi:CubicO group peptidase (beta-lactamase class C family)